MIFNLSENVVKIYKKWHLDLHTDYRPEGLVVVLNSGKYNW
jgi:hypothetical protein